jgi:hypothetical protein
MITKNILDKPFGPTGSFAGIFIFIVGIFATVMFSLTGLFLVFIGAFFGFTYTSTLIDFERKRVKFLNNLFGIIPYGQWLDIKQGMKLKLKRSNRTFRTYSQSNRTLDVAEKDIRLMLHSANNKSIIPLNKFKTLEAAKSGLKEYSERLELEKL